MSARVARRASLAREIMFWAREAELAASSESAAAAFDDYFLPLKPTSSFHFFVTYFAGFVALPFRGVEVGFEGPRLRLVF